MKRVVRSLRSLTPRGFTLPEVLVTVAIIAVLASAVVPTVVNQLGKGDTPALQSDLNSIRQAITNFSVDTRSYPRRMTDLNTGTHVTDGTALSLCPTSAQLAYGVNGANWKGPYLSTKLQLDSANTGVGHFKTSAYNLSILDTLQFVDGHIAVQVKSGSDTYLSASDAAKLKLAIDGANLDTAHATFNGHEGLVRFDTTAAVGGHYNSSAPVTILLVPVSGSC